MRTKAGLQMPTSKHIAQRGASNAQEVGDRMSAVISDVVLGRITTEEANETSLVAGSLMRATRVKPPSPTHEGSKK